MNMQALLKQAQNMQKDMLKAKEEIDNTHFNANNGLVDVEINGKKEVLNIKISPDFESDDLEALQDMLIIALNNAFKQVDKMTEDKMSKYSNIPGLF